VNFTDFMNLTGKVKNPFCRRGFSGVNMGHDADIARVIKIVYAF
jgi:hypothetical protein